MTGDGGRTFRVAARVARPVVALETAGRGAAVAQLSGGRALRTLDRGRTWRPFRLPLSGSFATASIGLGVRTSLSRGRLTVGLIATSDDGRSWRRRASPCDQSVAFSALVDLVTRGSAGSPASASPPPAARRKPSSARTTAGAAGGAEQISYPLARAARRDRQLARRAEMALIELTTSARRV